MRLKFYQDKAKDADHQSEVAALDLGVRSNHHVDLYVRNVGMLVNGCYISIMVMCMPVILFFLWLHA